MVFNSPEFLLFFALVLVAYWRVSHRIRLPLLVVSSWAFYAFWDWRFLSLLWISTAVDFVVAKRIAATQGPNRRRLLFCSMFSNLGMLGVFKYFDFFTAGAVDLLSTLGFAAHAPTLQLILPMGISFYTFQTMSYTIDVYRRRVEPETNPVVFAAYVAYFPQLVAGPIERPARLLPQLRTAPSIDVDRISSGAVLILIGLARKIVIADTVAPYVDRIFANTGGADSGLLALGVVLFAVQIYGDFAGYSDMARGLSRLLGIELVRNFEHPYFSTSIREFWRRWHISLSTWLRDYLYIELGGNRGGPWRTYRNLMITMLLGGLWHGASWKFVAWGGIHGFALCADRAVRSAGFVTRGLSSVRSIVGWCWTTLVVLFAWIFFRAATFSEALSVIKGIATLDFSLATLIREPLAGFACLLTLMLVIDVPQFVSTEHTRVLRFPWPIRGLTYATLVFAILLVKTNDSSPFIYFQF